MREVAGARPFWVDMESKLRTKLEDGTDIFDLNKAMRCIIDLLEIDDDGELRPLKRQVT